MAINANAFAPRLADRRLFLIAGIGFPLLILLAYSRSYYLIPFMDIKPLSNGIVHTHAAVMTLWVAYFTAQVFLVRSKNIKLHMTLGLAGIALAALVVITGMAAAYDSHIVRQTAPPGVKPFGFFAVPVFDMMNFIILFGAAVYYRKRPEYHKTLMLLTAINFLPAAVFRIPLVPEKYFILWAYGMPDLIALIAFGWYTWKHRKFNWAFALGIALIIVSQPVRVVLAGTQLWQNAVASIAP
jgi:hypothetical protein